VRPSPRPVTGIAYVTAFPSESLKVDEEMERLNFDTYTTRVYKLYLLLHGGQIILRLGI
jgi:hypothetical protein